MSTIFNADLTPTKDELVEGWIGEQRWYPGQGRRPRLRQLDSWRLDDPAGEVGIETLVYLDDSGSTPVVYQVPLTYRGAPLEGGEAALLGEMDHSVLGRRWVYDAPHDPVYVTQLLALLRGRATAQDGAVSDTTDPDIVGAPHPAWRDEPVVAGSRVLVGEQSNTSVVITPVEGSSAPVILKLFRTLAAGENPDITLQGALASSQSPVVPASVGHVAGAWQRSDDEGKDYGQLAFAQEYLAEATDAWRVCLAAAAAGAPFVDQARALGRAIAEVHMDLARILPTRQPTPEEIHHQVAAMYRRAGMAMSEVPGLAGEERRIGQVFAAAERASWPALQRIHGDLHLGQVLDVPGRGWMLIDFEGEPLRPLTERNALDSPLRDVAGILRSFDYVVGALAHAEARPWSEAAQTALLDGYADIGPDPRDQQDLLTAFILDKACYEVVYEARHRPSWLDLPTSAITRLLQEARS